MKGNRLLTFVLTLLLTHLSMVADNIDYYDCVWNSNTNTVDKTLRSRNMNAVPASCDTWVGLGNGWYYAQGNISYQTINVLGDDVNLVLCDGATITCSGGVRLEGPNHKLTIYSQSTGSNEGKLVVTQSYDGAAGIGCAANSEDDYGNIVGMGSLVVHGGDITATGSTRGAAIGGGKNRGISGTVIIYGGKVKALKDTSQSFGAGIGGGWCGGQGGDIYIYGGEVTAEGKGYGDEGGAGIGGGGGGRSEGGEGGKIFIYGGTVKASSNYASGGAAIGGGSTHTFDQINIHGGTVIAECEDKTIDGRRITARGAAIGAGYDCSQHGGIINITGGIVMAKAVDGAGIGGGYKGHGGQINISGGSVIATSEEGAGIGGGYKYDGGNVTVSGGTVTAYSSTYGAGIGGGHKGNGGTLTVTGGYVTAIGGTIEINWFKDHVPDFTAWKDNTSGKFSVALDFLGWIIVGAIKSGTYYGAGVGGGDDGKGGTVKVTGGTLHAMGGRSEAPGIGAGRKGGDGGNLEIGDNMMVFTSENDKYANYRTSDRKEKAHSQYNVYISDKTIPLSSYGSHASDLSALNGQKKNAMLTWRKFLCGGQYNALCLPFSLNDLTGTPLEGAKIYTVKSTRIENKMLILDLQEAAHKIDAGVPCFAKWDKPADYYKDPSKYDMETIVFEDVTIDASAPKSVELNNGTFTGAYDNVVYSELDRAQVIFKDDCYASPAYTNYSLRSFASNFKGKGNSKFGWDKGNFEQILFAVNGVLEKGDDIHYITHTWEISTGTLEQFECICPKVERISRQEDDAWTALDNHQWYLVGDAYVSRDALVVANDAYLILRDGTSLTLTSGLKTEYDRSLHIFGQAAGTGRLTVTQKHDDAAGIGGADGYSFGTGGIHGGIINVTGGKNGAGIGPGPARIDDYNIYRNPEKCDLYIYGGDITARGGKNAAGIGCSYASRPLNINIYGGTIKAYGGEDAAGIGGAYYYSDVPERYGDIVIYGGTIEATAGSGCVGRNAKKGSAIGAGYGAKDKDSGLTIGKRAANLKVSAGDAANNIERVFTTGEREPACHWRNYAKIEPCSHNDAEALSYTIIDDISHQERCKYCGYDSKQPHLYNATTHKCPCGKVEDAQPETWSVYFHLAKDATSTEYDEPNEFKVVKGERLAIPSFDTPEGLVFMQWMVNPENSQIDYEMEDSEFRPNDIYVEGYELWPSYDMHLYARYRYDSKEKWTWNANGDLKDVSATVEVEFPNGEKTGIMETTIERNYYEAEGDRPAFTRCIATVSYQRAQGVTYSFSDMIDRSALSELTLVNNENNLDKIIKNNYALVEKVKLAGRTLYRDGTWNSIVLPFDVTISGSPLDGEGVEVRCLETSTYFPTTNTVRMQFSQPLTEMSAGVPYLIKWSPTGSNVTNIVEPTFSNVVINSDRNNMSTNNVNFIGNYSPVTLEANDKTLRYVGANNMLYWPSADITLNSCRAYFRLTNIDNDNSQSLLLDLDTSKGNPTGIRVINQQSGDSQQMYIDDITYDLQGRMVVKGRLQQGINIVNGKKIINE